MYDLFVTRYFDAMLLHVDGAAMLRYFKRTNIYPFHLAVNSPISNGERWGKGEQRCEVLDGRGIGTRKRVKYMYNDCSATERARIGQYAAEIGPARAVHYFSMVFDKMVSENNEW